LAHVYHNKLPTISDFIFFIKSEAENQLKFRQHSTPAQCVCTQPPSCFVARCQTSSQCQTCDFSTRPISVLLITEFW